MTPVSRLVTFADVDAEPGLSGIHISARHEAELDNGSRIPLLSNRGWSSSGTWADQSLTEIDETARVVVGPDEPANGHTVLEAALDHWDDLRRILAGHGVSITVAELGRVPHDVVLSRRLMGRLDAGGTQPR